MTEDFSFDIQRLDARIDKLQAEIVEPPPMGVVTGDLVPSTANEYHISLIVVLSDDKSERIRHDETIACNTLAEARERMVQIQKRTTNHKRRIVICQQVQESKNFTSFK